MLKASSDVSSASLTPLFQRTQWKDEDEDENEDEDIATASTVMEESVAAIKAITVQSFAPPAAAVPVADVRSAAESAAAAEDRARKQQKLEAWKAKQQTALGAAGICVKSRQQQRF